MIKIEDIKVGKYYYLKNSDQIQKCLKVDLKNNIVFTDIEGVTKINKISRQVPDLIVQRKIDCLKSEIIELEKSLINETININDFTGFEVAIHLLKDFDDESYSEYDYCSGFISNITEENYIINIWDDLIEIPIKYYNGEFCNKVTFEIDTRIEENKEIVNKLKPYIY